MHQYFKPVFWLATALFIISCSSEKVSDDPSGQGRSLQIVCTTGMLGDALTRITGDRAEIITLMGPGVDPHLYKATQGDLRALTNADLVFYNGLHLEGKMVEVLKKLARLKPVIALAERIDTSLLIQSDDYAGAHDPHIWFDVSLWSQAVAAAGSEVVRLDPENAPYYQENTSRYLTELEALHQWVKEQITSIPDQQRVLITAHDAFAYFGRAYQIEVRGLQGISTMSEYGLRDVSDLVSFIVEQRIRSVFVESSVPAKSLEAVAEGCARRGHTVQIGGTLYSDAMGEAGTPEGTYPGMVRANVNTIVAGLQ